MPRDKKNLVEEIEREIAESEACRLGAGKIPVFAYGNPDTGVMIVGEGPGREEESLQRPFVGRAGQLLRRALSDLGLDLDRDFFVTNIVRYRSLRVTKDGRRLNAPPSATQVEGCRPFLEREIDVIKPRLIITLGVNAAKWFLGKGFNLTEGRGWVYEWRGIKLLPTYHPASALRPFGVAGAERKRRFEKDLAKAAYMIRESPKDYRIAT
ncbi:MAG: uracil-DNA glycosylase [Actinobacteria bacterium]|nr:uracil-DNA glycosylase [Actinomycetota bacterium]